MIRPEDQWAKSTRSEGAVESRRRGERELVLQRSLERSTKQGSGSRALLPPLARLLSLARARARSFFSLLPPSSPPHGLSGGGISLAGVAATRGGVCVRRNYDAVVEGHGGMFPHASHSSVDRTRTHEDVPIVWCGSKLSEQSLCRRLGISWREGGGGGRRRRRRVI
jgi:hypothetical protein